MSPTAPLAAPLSSPALELLAGRLPVLLVHGIDDTSRTLAPLAAHLGREGFAAVQAMDLRPNDGRAPIAELAAQVAAEAEALRARTGSARLDVVGFSMGALVSRYYLQRLEGRQHVRRFVSLSGPHAGTQLAWLRDNAGAREMRPGSALLQELAAQPEPFGTVQVFSLWTPWDLMIVPPRSSRLVGARERRVPVLLHPWMVTDRRVHRAVVEALSVERPEDFSPRA